jgi:hypothetical protein
MKNQDAQVEFEKPPGHGRPPHPWKDVPLAQWNDRRWQLSHRLNTVGDFAQVIHLTPEKVEGCLAPGLLCVDVTPCFASLMDPEDPACPVRLGQLGQIGENGSNGYHLELQIPVLLNTEGER